MSTLAVRSETVEPAAVRAWAEKMMNCEFRGKELREEIERFKAKGAKA